MAMIAASSWSLDDRPLHGFHGGHVVWSFTRRLNWLASSYEQLGSLAVVEVSMHLKCVSQ